MDNENVSARIVPIIVAIDVSIVSVLLNFPDEYLYIIPAAMRDKTVINVLFKDVAAHVKNLDV